MPRLLITNCSKDPDAGGVYLLDTTTGQTDRLHDQPSRGITRGPDGFYVVGNKGAISHIDSSTWNVTPRVDTGLEGSHDLRWIDGSFYLVASRGNWIVRMDRDLEVLDTMQVVKDPGDVCHANCLISIAGELLLTIFTLSSGTRDEKRLTRHWRREGKVLHLDWEAKSYRVLYEPLAQPHSLVWHEEKLYCCESFESELALLDLERGTKHTLRRLHGFVRGLVFAGGKAYVGISHSRIRRKVPLTQRLLGLFRLRCGVLEVDPKTWAPKRSFPLPGTEVYDMLVLDEGARR